MTKGLYCSLRIKCFRLVFILSIITFTARSKGELLDQWHWRNPLPQGNQLLNVVSANGTYVALGDAGTILTSTDGTNWTSRESGTIYSLHSCAYGAGKYVVVGDFGTVLTSTDLVSWSEQYAGTFLALDGITYGNSQFVAVGAGTTILTSPDGILWTPHSSGTWELFDVTYSGGTYVAVGGTLSPPATGVILTSQDGATWFLRSITDGAFYSVAAGQGKFAAAGGSLPTVWTSSDAINWTSVPNSPYLITRVTYGQGKWLASLGNIGDSGPFYTATGGIYISDDLTNFSFKVGVNGGIAGVASANGTFAAAREGGTFIVSSDASTWTNSSPESPYLNFHDLKFLNGSFVGVGDNGLFFSKDGTSWTNSVPLTNNFLSITYGNGRYVAGGEYRSVWTSTDGITWSNPAPELGIFPYVADVHVAFGNGTFVGASGYEADILTSADGLNWSVQQLTNGYYYTSFSDVTFGNGTFVAVSSPIIATSTGGTNWLVTQTAYALTSVAYGKGKFVAVGPGVIMTSPDGTNWTASASSDFGILSKVAFGGGVFVAVATRSVGQTIPQESAIWISEDGVHWSKRKSNTSRGLSTVAFGDGTFVVGGENSTLLQSDPLINLSLSMLGGPQLSIDGPANRNYRLEYSDNNAQWTPLTNISISGTPFTVSDTTGTNGPARFYRAVLLP